MVTIMFATHEMPQSGRLRVLRNAMRLARKIVKVQVRPAATTYCNPAARAPQHSSTQSSFAGGRHFARLPRGPRNQASAGIILPDG